MSRFSKTDIDVNTEYDGKKRDIGRTFISDQQEVYDCSVRIIVFEKTSRLEQARPLQNMIIQGVYVVLEPFASAFVQISCWA